jgi:endonuclease/exonuclease/phosphatase family metal-dependent hydrolase
MEVFMKKSCFLSFLICLLPITAALAACSIQAVKQDETSASGDTITLMTWNLQNLFDGTDRDTKYDEFRESAGWNNEKYQGRINAVRQAIESIGRKPDILIFEEVENMEVLGDISAVLNSRVQVHFAKNPDAALGLGIISRYPLLESRVHSVTINDSSAPRPVLEARIQADDTRFIIFACHWKSKLGGDEVTENTRKSSARVILRRIRELRETEPALGVIVAGDLNENHDEFFRQKSSVVCALLPDDPFCVVLASAENADSQKDYIVISKNKPPEASQFPRRTIALFSPWLRELENGSYYYRNNWETIDHFLLSHQFFNSTGLCYEKTKVLNQPPFANANGYPAAYNPRTGNGLSDHLPLILTLKIKQ